MVELSTHKILLVILKLKTFSNSSINLFNVLSWLKINNSSGRGVEVIKKRDFKLLNVNDKF